MEELSREVPLTPQKSVLLVIDVQNFCSSKNGGEYKDIAVPDSLRTETCVQLTGRRPRETNNVI